MDKAITALLGVLRNKKLLFRLVIVLLIVGGISYLILSDVSCHYKDFECNTKSKVSVDVKK
jgi:hypothetical protein